MAEKITLELEAKLGDAVKRLEGVEKQLVDIGKESKAASKGISFLEIENPDQTPSLGIISFIACIARGVAGAPQGNPKHI